MPAKCAEFAAFAVRRGAAGREKSTVTGAGAAIGFDRRTRDLGGLVRPPANGRVSGGRHSDDDLRCAEERGMCSQPAAAKMETPQQYCLRWKYHHSNLQAMFSQLLERECFCDVTLACEGKTLKAHKVMPCEYLKSVFFSNRLQVFEQWKC